MSIIIRPATEADQAIINTLIRVAHLNPRNLDWSRFLVAEDNARIVGIRQVRIHRQGSREVASGLVIPEYRRQGLSARLMRETLARESGPLVSKRAYNALIDGLTYKLYYLPHSRTLLNIEPMSAASYSKNQLT